MLNREKIFQKVILLLSGIQLFCHVGYTAEVGHEIELVAAVSAQSCPVSGEEEDGTLPSAPVRSVTEADIARCLKELGEVERVIHAGNSLVVDVRDSSMQMSHIDGTIAIPLYAVQGKNFIKDQSLVLLGNGANDRQLVGECIRLQKSAAKRVYILKGGVRTWAKRNSQSAALLQLADKLVAPQDIYISRVKKDWLILVDKVSDVSKQEVQKLFPDTRLIDTDFKKGIRQVLEKHGNTKFLVLTADGERYHEIHSRLQGYGVENDFYMKEGVAGYRGYLFTQQAYLKRMQEKEAKKKTLCGG